MGGGGGSAGCVVVLSWLGSSSQRRVLFGRFGRLGCPACCRFGTRSESTTKQRHTTRSSPCLSISNIRRCSDILTLRTVTGQLSSHSSSTQTMASVMIRSAFRPAVQAAFRRTSGAAVGQQARLMSSYFTPGKIIPTCISYVLASCCILFHASVGESHQTRKT